MVRHFLDLADLEPATLRAILDDAARLKASRRKPDAPKPLVGKAVIDIVSDEAFLENVRHVGLYLKQRLASVADAHPTVISEVRGEGLLAGIRCIPPAADVVTAMRENGLLSAAAGENVIRLLPPLIVTPAEVDEAITRLDSALASLDRSEPVARTG